jgi:hypothetical protein
MSSVSFSARRGRKSSSGSSKISLGRNLRRWQTRLGLQSWRIRLTRVQERRPEGYPGTESSEQGVNAGYCECDPHRMVAVIYVAPDELLGEIAVDPEEVLVHELLHLRLGHLVMIPPGEATGQALLLEHAIHGLTRALIGTGSASPRRKGGSK